MSHIQALLIAVFVIAIASWRLRRLHKRSAMMADLWFKETAVGYIYQPYGRFGKAYIVQPGVKDEVIERRLALFKFYIILLFVLYVLPSLIVAIDTDLFYQVRRVIWPIRLGLVLVAGILSFIWSRLTIYPLYAEAPRSAERIPYGAVLKKHAAATSWPGLLTRPILLLILALGLGWGAYTTKSAPMAGLAVFVIAFLLWSGLRVFQIGQAKLNLDAAATSVARGPDLR